MSNAWKHLETVTRREKRRKRLRWLTLLCGGVFVVAVLSNTPRFQYLMWKLTGDQGWAEWAQVEESTSDPADGAPPHESTLPHAPPEPVLPEIDARPDREFVVPDIGVQAGNDRNANSGAAGRPKEEQDATKHREEVREWLQTLPPEQAIERLLALREETPSVTNLDTIGPLLHEWGHRPWLRLAAQEASDVPPSDAGFGEVWLPIARAWERFGEPAEAREALRQAKASTERMLTANQQYLWFLHMFREGLLEQEEAIRLCQSAEKRTAELSDPFEVRAVKSNLSGIAQLLGKTSDARRLLAEAADPELEKKATFRIDGYHLPKYRAWAASWHAAPQEIEQLAQQLERLNYRRMELIANAYANGGMAAARDRNKRQFYRMMFRAEAAISQKTFRDKFVYPHAQRLAEAYRRYGLWRPALIVGNNLTDPVMVASFNFQVLADAPQEVRRAGLREMFEQHGNVRYASSGMAGYSEHQLRSGVEPLDLIAWLQSLEHPALRAAGYAGVSRAVDTFGQPPGSRTDAGNVVSEMSLEIPRSILEEAQRQAEEIPDPLDSASALVEVARAWSLTGRQQSYEAAIQQTHERCFDAWAGIWEKRPPAGRSYDGYYSDTSYRRRRSELDDLTRLLQVQRQLASMQADVGDAQGTLDSCLHLAITAGYLDKQDQALVDWNYCLAESLVTRTEHGTGIGSEVFSSRYRVPPLYHQTITAIWEGNLPKANALLNKLRQEGPKKGQLARVNAELAVAYAERGDLQQYRAARRSAYSEIAQGRVKPSFANVLAVADAKMGELALAESSFVDQKLEWFDQERPKSEIAVGYARRGDWKKALEAAQDTNRSNPVFRCRAFRAVAQSRYAQEPNRQTLSDWVGQLSAPVDRVGALCGLALAAEGIELR
ncbi:MAG: hypothetical protein KDA61_02005 [Planctomycetales bacterium]|nr:hypothetical protein [Planctomycetales bacterium]